MRSRSAVVLVLVSLALLAYVIFGGSDEDKIVLRVKELAAAVETRPDESNVVFRTARINKVFKAALDPEITFRAPELPSKTGIRELALLAAEAGQTFGNVRLSVGATDVHVAGDTARAVSEITLTSERGNELHGDRRSVRFELRRSGGDWRVRSIDVAEKGGEPPEARP